MVDVNATVIFCDDIRQEMSGKFILVGAYVGEVIVDQFPTNFTLATYVQITGLSLGKHEISSRVLSRRPGSELQLGQIEFAMDVTRPDLPSAIAPTGLVVSLEAEGTLDVVISVDGGSDRLAGSLKVARRPEALLEATSQR